MSIMNKNRREILKQTTEVHRANIQKQLEQRLAVARAKGDRELIRILEAEASYFS